MSSWSALDTAIGNEIDQGWHDKRGFLRRELKPDWYENGYMVPCDRQVNGLNRPVPGEHGDPISRAPDVLRCLGIDPFQVDAWVDMIGVDISRIPIIGEVGDGKKRRRLS